MPVLEPSDVSSLTYLLDVNNVIQEFDAHQWDESLKAAGVPLTSNTYIGNPLWRFCSSPELVTLLKAVFDKVRLSKKSISLPFRCDSPDLRRRMLFTARPLLNGYVEVTSTTLQAKPRDRVNFSFTASPVPTPLTMCAWCNKVGNRDNGWLELEPAIEQFSLFEKAQLPQLSHSICPDCEILFRKELDSVL